MLGSNIGAIRSLHFSHDGQYLAAAGKIYHLMSYDGCCIGNIIYFTQSPLTLYTSMKRSTLNQVKSLTCLAILPVSVSVSMNITSNLIFTIYKYVAFTPEDQSLYIANADERVG